VTTRSSVQKGRKFSTRLDAALSTGQKVLLSVPKTRAYTEKWRSSSLLCFITAAGNIDVPGRDASCNKPHNRLLNPAAPWPTHHNTYCKSKMSAECVVNALALLQAHAEAASLKSSALSGFEQHSQRARLQSSVDSPGSIEYTEVKDSDHLQGHHVCRLTHNEAVGGFIQR
jgi:hypothetical protein